MALDDRFLEASDILGYVSPDILCDLVVQSNHQQMLYHGIKDPGSVGRIVKEGLKPLTPETFSSCWATGIKLFFPPDDSPLFTYSGMYLPDECNLNIAMAEFGDVKGIKRLLSPKMPLISAYYHDSQILVKDAVPFESMVIINVVLRHSQTQDNSMLRKYCQKAEQMMIAAIRSQLYDDFTPGKIVKYNDDKKE